MPKLKTVKGVAKRFKVTGSGRIKRSSAGKGHLLTGKARERKRRMRHGGYVGAADLAVVRQMLPHA